MWSSTLLGSVCLALAVFSLAAAMVVPEVCDDDHFSCGNGQCVPRSWTCDGENDCTNNRDESHCVDVCEESQFLCPRTPESAFDCIHRSWVCDGDVDCENGQDEDNCPARGNNVPNPLEK